MPIHPRSAPYPVRTVELLAFPLVQLLDVTGPFQVFASANDLVLEAGGRPPYDLQVVAQNGVQVTTSAGLKLSTRPLPLASAAVDTLMVAGGQGVEAADPVIIEWVQARARRARRIASVCTRAFHWPRPSARRAPSRHPLVVLCRTRPPFSQGTR